MRRHAAGPQAVILLLLALWPAAVQAHGDGEPWLLVLESNIRQGETFTLNGDDLDPDEDAVLEISSFGEVHPLGVAQTDEFGHFGVELTTPAELRDGYALIEATTTSGSVASRWVLVGERPDLNAGLPGAGPAEQPPLWADPSVLILGVFLGGTGTALLYLLFRQRARRAAAVPAKTRAIAAGTPPRVVPRKSKTRAKHRRA